MSALTKYTRRFGYYSFFVLVTVISILLLTFYKQYTQPKIETIQPPVAILEQSELSMMMGSKWFRNVQRPSGDFTYEIAIETNTSLTGNNIVRQAGSLYALAQYYRYTKDKKTKDTLEKGFAYFQTLTISEGENGSAIVYGDVKKSNAVALLLLGLLEYLETEPNASTKYFIWAEELADYLVYTQTPSGSFIYQYGPPNTESDFNNGESFYALARAASFFNDDGYLQAAKKSAEYNLKAYNGDFNSGFYSWGMAGFAHLYQIDPQEKYWQFMKTTTDTYLAQNRPVTPGAAVFIEGIAHVAWLASEKNPQYFNALQAYVQQRLRELYKYQIGFPDSVVIITSPLLTGGVCITTNCDSIRIDFTQHLMSANYLYLLYIHARS